MPRPRLRREWRRARGAFDPRRERGFTRAKIPRFSSIDEASNFANLLRATLPRHGFVVSEPYPIISDSLEKEFKERCDTPADLLGRIDEL